MRQRSLPAGLLLAMMLSFAAPRAHAKPPALEVTLEGRVGQSTAPYFTRAFPETSGYGGILLAAARYRFSDRLQLGLRAPLVLMRVEQPAGALYAEAAWANPEIDATFEQPWLQRDGWRLSLETRLAIGAPVAEHDSAHLSQRALRLADALEGFSEPALYTPGALPVTPAGRLVLQSPRWKLAALFALPLLFRVSNANLPEDSEARSVAFVPVFGLDARLRCLPWLSVGVAPRLTALARPPAEDHAPSLQLLAAGHVDFDLGQHLALSALLQAPLGGALGGTTVAGGLQLRASF
ncbi:MAG: hypothetical protein EOO73_19105 [Myxococcales bacterium]|nr:MAG: hypothetical protein EOO73_19105 [Myxococcales bacterium]